jgi:PAS domain S-box-containing protein
MVTVPSRPVPGVAPDEAQRAAELIDFVLRLMPDAAVVVDQEGRVVAANPSAETMFGYPRGGLDGVAVDVLVPERFRPGHARHRANYVAVPTNRPMGAAVELWATRLDGTEFQVDISLAPLGVPAQALTLAAVRDLTGRRSEWEAGARLAAIVASSDDAIVSMDLGGTLMSWNPGAERLLGYRADEIVGRPVWRLIPEELHSEVEEQMARVRGGMHIPTHDTVRRHRDGHGVEVAVALSLIHDPSGSPTGMSAVMRDITERKRVERELRRLLVDGQRRERWLSAISEVRLAMLGGGDLDQWLALIARRVSELADADGITVSVLADDDDTLLEVIAAHGAPVESLRGELLPVDDSLSGRVFTSGRSAASTGPHDGPGSRPTGEAAPVIGPVLLVPISTSHGPDGVLGVVRGAGSTPFNPEEIRVVESFGQQAGLAIELARAQDDREQLALIGDRERIARDLHDHVIQRLFAVGMALQAATHSITDSVALDRIAESVEELDATIRDVRSTIFSLALRATDRVEGSTRARILDIASRAADALGFQPRLQFDGPVDTKVPESLVPDVLAVVRETLSNVARHAHASRVEVRVDVHDDLSISVTDDGTGMGGTTRSSGLANLRARAEARGGTMTAGDGGAGGTRIVWRVPLEA